METQKNKESPRDHIAVKTNNTYLTQQWLGVTNVLEGSISTGKTKMTILKILFEFGFDFMRNTCWRAILGNVNYVVRIFLNSK